MEPEAPQDEQDQQPQEQQPAIDPRMALELAAQQYGVTPDVLESSLRLQSENQRVYEENRRRARELELREAEINALARERQQYMPPQPQYEIDPAVRPLYEKLTSLEQRMLERDRREQEAERMQAENQRVGAELNSHFESLMRRVPSQGQVDANQFFQAMQELWPNAEFKSLGLSPAQAVERTARYLGIKANGIENRYTQPTIISNQSNPLRDPRAQIVIPGASAGIAQTPTTGNGDVPPQIRPGESQEQFDSRAREWWSNRLNNRGHGQIVREGVKFSSG